MKIANGTEIRVTTSSTADIDVTAYYDGKRGGRIQTKITTATTTQVCAAPSGDRFRTVEQLTIYNVHGATSNTITVLDHDGVSVSTRLWYGTLLAGESVHYVDGVGWQKLSTNGVPVVGAA